MKKLILTFLFVSIITGVYAQSGAALVEIATDSGKIVVKLYDQTPLHKKNFLKIIKEGYYNKAVFHRVIKDFMVQGGESSDPKAAAKYPNLIPAEIIDTIYNKRGVLCAARTADQVNPERKSSPVQFYIVQGKKFSNGQLNSVENTINSANFNLFAFKLLRQISDSIKKVLPTTADSVIQRVTFERAKKTYRPYVMTDKQREIYTTIGGAPHLDGQYTVFGEVVEGMDVVDKLAAVEVGQGSRPVKELKMKIKIIN